MTKSTDDEKHEANTKRLDAIEAELKAIREMITLVRGGLGMLVILGKIAAAVSAGIFGWIKLRSHS